MIDEKTRVEVESIGVGSVGYQPEHNPLIRRKWDKPGVKKKIPFEEIQEVMSSTGGYNLFRYHLLIKDPEVREALDLPVEAADLMSDKDLEDLLNGSLPNLKKKIDSLSKELQKRLAEKAVEMNIDSVPKIKLIKDVTGIDVYKMLEQKNEAE